MVARPLQQNLINNVENMTLNFVYIQLTVACIENEKISKLSVTFFSPSMVYMRSSHQSSEKISVHESTIEDG